MSEKKRWICLYVENEIGVLARISGLFSGKSYNLNSLTVGETEDTTISRMTISFTSDDRIFEQVKKQLNRSVEVIKVLIIQIFRFIIKRFCLLRSRNVIRMIRMRYSALQMHLILELPTTIKRIFWQSVYRQRIRIMMRSNYSNRVFRTESRSFEGEVLLQKQSVCQNVKGEKDYEISDSKSESCQCNSR